MFVLGCHFLSNSKIVQKMKKKIQDHVIIIVNQQNDAVIFEMWTKHGDDDKRQSKCDICT